MPLGYSTIILNYLSTKTLSPLFLEHPAPPSAVLTPILTDSDTMIVYSESDSSFLDSEPSNAEPSNSHQCESVSKAKMINRIEKIKIVDPMRSKIKKKMHMH